MIKNIRKRILALQESIKNNAGYSLMEMMVVLIIIGIIAAIAVPNINKALTKADITTAKTMVKSKIPMALVNYRSENGNYPSTEDGLAILLEGKYLKRSEIKDPWGTEYQYVAPGEKTSEPYEVWSLGPDRKDGGTGQNKDITSWDAEDAEDGGE